MKTLLVPKCETIQFQTHIAWYSFFNCVYKNKFILTAKLLYDESIKIIILFSLTEKQCWKPYLICKCWKTHVIHTLILIVHVQFEFLSISYANVFMSMQSTCSLMNPKIRVGVFWKNILIFMPLYDSSIENNILFSLIE